MSIIYIACLLINFISAKFIVGSYFGIFDDGYTETMSINKTIPWVMFDRIYISFAILDEYGNLTNSNADYHKKILEIVSLYKRARPNGLVFISSTFGNFMDERYLYAANHSVEFSRSVLRYLEKYNIDGLDIDWETVQINKYATELITLITACKKLFKAKYKVTHAIWPNVHDAPTIGLLANIIDEINIMSYATDISVYQLEYLIKQYHDSGFPYEKMIIGIETELVSESKNIIVAKVKLIHKYNLAGVFLYRLDNDDRPEINETNRGLPTFKTTKLLYDVLYN